MLLSGKIRAAKSGQENPGLHVPAAAIMGICPVSRSTAAAIARD